VLDIRKWKLEQKISTLEFRIKELEEKLCPCEQHDYIVVDKIVKYNTYDVDYYEKRVCSRCGKTRIDRVYSAT